MAQVFRSDDRYDHRHYCRAPNLSLAPGKPGGISANRLVLVDRGRAPSYSASHLHGLPRARAPSNPCRARETNSVARSRTHAEVDARVRPGRSSLQNADRKFNHASDAVPHSNCESQRQDYRWLQVKLTDLEPRAVQYLPAPLQFKDEPPTTREMTLNPGSDAPVYVDVVQQAEIGGPLTLWHTIAGQERQLTALGDFTLLLDNGGRARLEVFRDQALKPWTF